MTHLKNQNNENNREEKEEKAVINNKGVNPVVYFVICLITMICFNLTLTNHILHNIFLGTTNYKLIDIVYVQNTGAAFSSFQHSTFILICIGIIAIAAILTELFRDVYKYSLSMHFASAVLVTGILCNTWERFSLGYVRDFINIKFIEFPVFNISDILINLGVLVIIILIITKKYKKNG